MGFHCCTGLTEFISQVLQPVDTAGHQDGIRGVCQEADGRSADARGGPVVRARVRVMASKYFRRLSLIKRLMPMKQPYSRTWSGAAIHSLPFGIYSTPRLTGSTGLKPERHVRLGSHNTAATKLWWNWSK